MNVVDSSCWLEYFGDTRVGNELAAVIEDLGELLVPVITIYEVFKKLLLELDEDRAIFAVAHMKQGHVVELDADLAVQAARIGRDHGLTMTDSIIYATARRYDAVLYTQDRHFKEKESVRFFE